MVYIAKNVEKKKKLVLLPVEKKKVATSKRSNPGVPVPNEMRVCGQHYCENCQCHYGKKEDLTKQVKYMCGKTVLDYICDTCEKGFHTENGVREHYYQTLLKQFLYHCTKCNKGFYFKSKKSNHKKACPNINDEEKYKGKADLDPELEKTFQRRKLVELDTDKERSEDSEEEVFICFLRMFRQSRPVFSLILVYFVSYISTVTTCTYKSYKHKINTTE